MSFFRPEVTRALTKWAEAIAMGAVLVAGLMMYLRAEATANSPLLVLSAILIAAGAALTVLAIRRVRMHSDKRAAGVVEVQERKITYYGPDDGGVMSIDDLRRIDIVCRIEPPFLNTLHWRLSDHEGRALHIPVGAEGTDTMIDNFSVLSGVDYQLIVRAMHAKKTEVFTIWRDRA